MPLPIAQQVVPSDKGEAKSAAANATSLHIMKIPNAAPTHKAHRIHHVKQKKQPAMGKQSQAMLSAPLTQHQISVPCSVLL